MSTIPTTMSCIEIREPGGPEVLVPAVRPVPEPGPNEVLIKIVAAGVNRPDIVQRRGLYPAPPGASDLPGLEVSGHICATGANVTDWSMGEEVCALLPGGGYAQYATADAGSCLPIPSTVSLSDAAGLPETYFTVWTNVFEGGALKAGETLLVHGGTSGIGTSAIGLAKAMGANVIATAGTQEKCDALLSLGVGHAFRYDDDDWQNAISADPINGVDVILDMAGGDFLEKNIACLRPGGRHVSIAFLRGNQGTVNIFDVMRKNLTITGSTLRARDNSEKERLAQAIKTKVWPHFESGILAPKTDTIFPLHKAAEAHALMESRQHMGKILLEV